MKVEMILVVTCAAALSVHGAVELSTSADRVESPLRVNMRYVGTLAPRGVKDIRGSNWTLGCETLDRDYADWSQYSRFLPDLGCTRGRLFSGWAKTEQEKGVSAVTENKSFNSR